METTESPANFKFGEKVRLTCDVSGYPIPAVRWYKNNTPLKKSERFTLLDDNSLVIGRAAPIDTGLYTCRQVSTFSRTSLANG